MSKSLYRKYRPKTFSEMVGQQHVKVSLTHQLEQGGFSHAYLFCGPRAVGKTTSARLLAKAINCEKRKEGEHEPCNECNTCTQINEQKAIDIIEIDAASHTGVDHVREHIIANARVVPNQLTYKVFIIDEVHMLSISAFNALLKILEEPPSYVVFILATTEIHKVPQTIISRCQRFDFERISLTDMVKRLEYVVSQEGIACDREILERIAKRSQGCVRDAESLLGQVIALATTQEGDKKLSGELVDLILPKGYQQHVVDLVSTISQKDTKKALHIVSEVVHSGGRIEELFEEYVKYLRFLLLYKVTAQLDDLSSFLSADQLKGVLQSVEQYSSDTLKGWLEIALSKQPLLGQSYFLQLPLELAILESTQFSSTPSVMPKKQEESVQKEEVVQPASVPASTMDGIQEKWVTFLSESQKVNPSLPFILKVSKPASFDDKHLVIAFKYALHQEKANEPGMKGAIEKTAKGVFGEDVSVSFQVDESMQTTPLETQKEFSDAQVKDVLDTFGGTIIEES